MKKYFQYIFLIPISVALVIFFISLNAEPVRFKETRVGSDLFIQLPDYLLDTDSLDPAAAVQCSSRTDDVFFIAYEYTQDTLPLPEAFERFSNKLVRYLSHGGLQNYYPKKLNNCNAIMGTITGKLQDVAVIYKMALVNTQNKKYELIFGLTKNSTGKYSSDIETSLRSLVGR